MPLPDHFAAAKWPTVPACHGWLSLDRRGRWLLKGQGISHAGLLAFINSRYRADGSGNWIVQNGSQTVFVALDYTPFVWRLELDDSLTAHTGAATGPIAAAYLDEEGNLLLQTALGIGILNDRDLPAFLAACRDARGDPAGDDALLATLDGGTCVFWHGLPLQVIKRGDVPRRFGFRPDPAP
ncbi:MAG: DUF2946 family protein [Sulfuritalea sp.]|jgi:hypothetical protein|nr:DUF2946 family protein [Sulfuritalea sp.]